MFYCIQYQWTGNCQDCILMDRKKWGVQGEREAVETPTHNILLSPLTHHLGKMMTTVCIINAATLAANGAG
jgi:hypothetical protein